MLEYTLVMQAKADVQVNIDEARQWFLNLKEHPEQYTFASHQGFYFTQGDFGEIGAKFYTKERFHGIPAKLNFTLTEVTSHSFTFVLESPIRNIKGQFTLTELEEDLTTISLLIYTLNNQIQHLFKIKPLYQAVHNQITREVQHIKTSLENEGK